MDKNLIEFAVSIWRNNKTKKVVFYIHKKCKDDDLRAIFGINGIGIQKDDVFNDDLAHVLITTNTAVCYRVKNEVYIIPATIKAIVNNNDGKINLWFDYPVEMDRKDLVKY